MTLRVVTAQEVAERLTYDVCIPLMRDAMIALSEGRTQQLLRGIIDLDNGNAFGVMPGALNSGPFGAKLVSVVPGNTAAGGMSHQGLVVLFDQDSGAPTAVLDAGEITAVRTAAASAAATDVLARPDASRLMIIGTGEQALRHVEAIARVRRLESVRIWGRSAKGAAIIATQLAARGFNAEAASDLSGAVGRADIICTLTAAPEPILLGEWVSDGTHVNAVGSARAGPAEIDNALVARARFIADHRQSVLVQGAEFLRAKAAGLVGDGHVAGEIGEIFSGRLPGRTRPDEVTIYKSLGSIVQDLASAAYLLQPRAPGEDR